jgi:exodeoxyribonuclease VII small subunit
MTTPDHTTSSYQGAPEPAPPNDDAAPEPAPPTYEAAVARIEEIIRRLDSGQAGLRETLSLVKEGRNLVEYCAGELDAVGHGLEELKLDDLVARLEGAQAARSDR